MANSYLSKVRPWRELSLWMLVMLQTSWLVPWYFLVVPEPASVSPLRVFVIFWLLVMIANTAMRLLYEFHCGRLFRQIVMVTMFVAVEAAGLKLLVYSQVSISFYEFLNRSLDNLTDWREFIPLDIVIIFLVLLAWWRGIDLSQGPVDSAMVRGQFRFGTMMCLILIVLDFNITTINISPFVYTFIFCGLVAMSCARIAVLENLRGGRRYSLDWRWALGIVTLAAGLTFLAGITSFFFGGIYPFIFKLLSIPVLIILGLLILLSIPVLYLLIWILSQISNPTGLLDLIYRILEQLSSLINLLIENLKAIIAKSPFNPIFGKLVLYIKPVFLISLLLLALMIVLLWAAYERQLERNRANVSEERLSLEPDPLLAGLRNALKRSLDKILSLFENNAYLKRRRHAAARIRQIYADLMDISERIGHPRPEGFTPLEFMPVLKDTFPALEEEIELITTRYLSVRYGELAETFWDLNPVEQAWTRISTQAQEHLEAARLKARNKKQQG